MSYLTGFSEFWAVYPRRVAKNGAIKAYGRALKSATPDVILEGARRYAREKSGADVTFIAHASTWLNNARWCDYEAEAAPPKAVGFYASFTADAELAAWDAYGMRTRGRGYPRDKQGGWWFPTRWPPE